MKTRLAFGFFAILIAAGLYAQSASQSSWGDANWIWDSPDGATNPQSNDPRYFRIRFNLSDAPAAAELWATADNEYVAYVNGKKVGGGTAWEKTDKYDVAKILVKGDNVVAIEARNNGGIAGAIARLWVQLADKKERIIATGSSTKASRLAPKNWTAIDFDDAKWAAADVLGDSKMGPWNVAGIATGGVVGKGGKSSDVTSDGKIQQRLSSADELKEFKVPENFTIELVADEPLIINPVTMTVDDKGRILVSESHTYRFGPSGSPVKPYRNPLVRLDPKPDGKGFDRVLIADGFEDPVMGIQVKDGKLFAAACQFLYVYDYNDQGPATNKKMIVSDKTKAWNPFGMFVLEFGPDGLLYMSVGDHKVQLVGPTNTIESRGSSGVVVRMNPDGSNMERLTQGFRVPYSFEFDPFGQLWLLSNGEGNPNRFARIIPGVDYHCYTRGKADNNWLAGNHPLAPPTFELMRGAHTQLMRYYGGAYPKEYEGSLLLCNWGAHGFHGPNRAIFRYHPDDRGQIVTKEAFVSCNDPHFRPAHICLDNDGNLLIADWYGRDDESDMTGRIWRVRYKGNVEKMARLKDNATDAELLDVLGSTSHIDRQKAMDRLVAKGNEKALGEFAATTKNALAGANALWCLTRLPTKTAKLALLDGVRNSDPKVRRLALDLGRRFQGDLEADEYAVRKTAASLLKKDEDHAVQLEAAIALGTSEALIDALKRGAYMDVHLRYQAAAELAKVVKEQELVELLGSRAPELRLAGLIAIDVACYENTPSKKAAFAAINHVLDRPESPETVHAIFLLQQHADPSTLPVLEKLIAREDLSPAITGKAMLTYRTIAGKLPPNSGKRFLEGVQKGTISLATTADHLALIELLESEGPTPFAVDQLGKEIRANNPQVKPAALALARRFGPKSSAIADYLWPTVLNPKAKAEDSLEALATIAVIQDSPRSEPWSKLLNSDDPTLRTDAVRWWRVFKKNPEMIKVLGDQAGALVKTDPDLGDDVSTVYRELGLSQPGIRPDDGKRDKAELAKLATQSMTTWSAADKQKHALLGKQIFERSACTKCHTTATQTTLLAPSLKGIGGQKIDYLIESILEPSKIIKTGFNTELVVTTAGKSLTGLVKEEDKHLRILTADSDIRVLKSDVEQRTPQKQSIMPDGQETQLSRREFVDLIAYLSSLK